MKKALLYLLTSLGLITTSAVAATNNQLQLTPQQTIMLKLTLFGDCNKSAHNGNSLYDWPQPPAESNEGIRAFCRLQTNKRFVEFSSRSLSDMNLLQQRTVLTAMYFAKNVPADSDCYDFILTDECRDDIKQVSKNKMNEQDLAFIKQIIDSNNLNPKLLSEFQKEFNK